eukprot:CAMPEP_0197466354 /NCGR_PEP_ID=MMETSP1175-20131217/65007_1 /TAXON_ID=1003142 /ORGANISM="Triceratium dubium, Strain CCMP147" /LENGTH=340 /DNA_ID=CAMNT_0043002389 /DNA_START=140 /DNA_END=1162 /DNA_ORIENTATION=+
MPMQHQTHLSYGPPLTQTTAMQPAVPNLSFQQQLATQPPHERDSSVPGDSSDKTQHVLHQSYLAALSRSDDSAKTIRDAGLVAPRVHPESQSETGKLKSEKSTDTSDTMSPEQQMDMHKLIPSLLKEASSLMSSIAPGGQHSMPGSESEAEIGSCTSSQTIPDAQTYPSQPDVSQEKNRYSQPQQQRDISSAKGRSLPHAPKPPLTTTSNSYDGYIHPNPMSAEEYFVSAQATAIAVSEHSAYSFLAPQNTSDHFFKQKKRVREDEIPAAYVREHHKRQRFDSFAAVGDVIARNAHVISSSEKSSEIGTESESAIASSDFGSENSSDNASANSEHGGGES